MTLANSQNEKLTAIWTASPSTAIRVVTEALSRCSGSVSEAAMELSVSRRTLTRWIADTPQLQRSLEAIRTEVRADLAAANAQRRAARRRASH